MVKMWQHVSHSNAKQLFKKTFLKVNETKPGKKQRKSIKLIHFLKFLAYRSRLLNFISVRNAKLYPS